MNLLYLGRIKFRLERVRAYALWLQAVMVLDIWLSSRGVSWWVAILVGLPVFFIIYYIDRKYVYPGESGVAFRDNPEWNKLMKRLDS